MSYSQVLEVAIGLVLVYYLLGSIVSWITGMIIEVQETRGQVLEEYLKKTVGTKTIEDLKTGRKKEVNILADQYQIKSLQPIRYKNLLSVFGAVTEAKMVEKIPVSTLVDAFFDVTGLTGRPKMEATELKNMINALPNSEGKQAMLKWIDQGVTNVNTLQARANAYFTGIIDQAACKFKANARSFVILLSIAVTLILGTDSIQLAKDLWNNAELRAITAVQADALVQQGNQVLDLDAIIEELKQAIHCQVRVVADGGRTSHGCQRDGLDRIRSVEIARPGFHCRGRFAGIILLVRSHEEDDSPGCQQ